MTPLFKKLSLGSQAVVHVLDAPPSFESEIAALEGVRVERTVTGPVAFAIAFVTTESGLAAAGSQLAEACVGDAVLWMAYPKRTSKRYHCEFHRDSGWPVLRDAGFDSVRMVAIDDDWSALRFRRVQFIKSAAVKPLPHAAGDDPAAQGLSA